MAFFFFFNDTATTEIYTLSLHDALPICTSRLGEGPFCGMALSLAPARPWLVMTTSSPCWTSLTSFSRSRSEEHTSELQSHSDLVCRLLLEKKKEATYKLNADRNSK